MDETYKNPIPGCPGCVKHEHEKCPDGHGARVTLANSDERTCTRCGRVWTGLALAKGGVCHRVERVLP